MTRLNDSITFLNAYQSYCSEYEGYSDETDDKGKVIAKGSRHNVMGSKCLGGVGKYYRHLQDSNKTNIENADELASITTGMRNIANMQSKILFEELLKIVTVVD